VPRRRHDALIFWPYRPREGYPSVPGWLFFVILVVVIAVYLTFLTVFSRFR
jgi:hypothetical protein